MFIELKEQTYNRGGYISTNIMFALDDIARVIECTDDYSCTNIITKDGKKHTINERYENVVKKIKEALGIAGEIDEAREAAPVAGNASDRACEGEADDVEKREYDAFDNYIRGSILHERSGELEPANNGAIVPVTIARKIIELVYDICPILARSDKYTVDRKSVV